MESSGTPDNHRSMYFAYGSNLSTSQMRDRCPSSVAVGLAHLSGWKWIINERGYANVVQTQNQDPPTATASPFVPLPLQPTQLNQGDRVYGVLYVLHPADEARLDACEGVPWAYERQLLDVDVDFIKFKAKSTGDQCIMQQLCNITTSKEAKEADQETSGIKIKALVYVDAQNKAPAHPRVEYVDRMNRGIEEAKTEWMLPPGYIDTVLRPFIPAKE